MGLFWGNDDENEEEYGELENTSRKNNKKLGELKETLGELQCEEAIIKDKERFGRVRTHLMKVLRVEYGDDVANRALGRINKRIQEGYLNS